MLRMPFLMLRALATVLLAFAALAAVAPAAVVPAAVVPAAVVPPHARDPYPVKPVRLVIPFPPGGPADIIARPVAAKLGENLGQPFVIDNRGGGNGNIGAEIAARSPADGYTLLLVPSALAANRSLYAKLPYSLDKDFTGIAGLAVFPLLLVTHPSVQATNVRELVALAKQKPGALDYASAGSGGGAHLAAESFRLAT